MPDTHFRERVAHPTTACGLDFRTHGMLFFTVHKLGVTCPDCQQTPAFARATQIIPTVPGGPYRGN